VPSRLQDVVTRILGDRELTDQEWADAEEADAGLPRVASEVCRMVLDAWLDDGLAVSAPTRAGMAAFLRSHGYDARTNLTRDAIIASNVTERDATFARLAEVTGRADETLTLAVLDNGFDLEHGALKDHRPGWDFVDSDADATAPNETLAWYDPGHGTHVMGVATRGTYQIHGVGHRVLRPGMDDGNNPSRALAGIHAAAREGATVINLSFGFLGENVAKALEAVSAYPDITFVVAAGNHCGELGTGPWAPERFLAANRLPNLIVVANADGDGRKFMSSNVGEVGQDRVHVAAPGTAVFSSVPGGYGYRNGTSMAAPAVTNLVAKCLLLDPGLGPEQVRRLVVATAKDPASFFPLPVVEGGVIQPDLAMKTAAFTALRRSGVAAEEAAIRLGLTREERPQIETLAKELLEAA
jgi:subtilisin family serine protease